MALCSSYFGGNLISFFSLFFRVNVREVLRWESVDAHKSGRKCYVAEELMGARHP